MQMKVPLIDRINDLQVGLNSLQNPSFPSQITSSLASVSVAYKFCQWGAIILALVATFSSIINRITIFIFRFRSKAPSLPSLQYDYVYTSDDDDDEFEFQNDDDDDDDLTYSSSESEDEPSAASSFLRLDEYFRLRGTGGSDERMENNDKNETQNGAHKRRRSIGDISSLAELATNKSVVKLWNSLGFGLGLDFDEYEDGVFSGYDAPSTSTASTGLVLSAGDGAWLNMEQEILDTCLRRRKPTVVAEWGPAVGNTLRV